MTYQRTENELLAERLMERVKALDPELALELSDAHNQEMVDAENRAIRHQGRVILAAIEGDLVAWPGSVPDWKNEPDWDKPEASRTTPEIADRLDALTDRLDAALDRLAVKS